MHLIKKVSYLVASDVHLRDGVGLETYIDGNLVMEIFRDDSEKRAYMTLFATSVDLNVIDASVEKFKECIGLDYIEYPDS